MVGPFSPQPSGELGFCIRSAHTPSTPRRNIGFYYYVSSKGGGGAACQHHSIEIVGCDDYDNNNNNITIYSIKAQTHRPTAVLNMYYIHAFKRANDVTAVPFWLGKSVTLLPHLSFEFQYSVVFKQLFIVPDVSHPWHENLLLYFYRAMFSSLFKFPTPSDSVAPEL